MRTCLVALLLCAAAGLALAPATADEVVRVPAASPAFDRNGDGFADVLVDGRTVHHDADFDGRFDYSLTLAFKEYETEGHARYVAGGFDREVFTELTRAGLDRLCASERIAADWTAVHFRDFLYYRDGYGRLSLFDGSPGNDGRLAGKSPRWSYEYVVEFNPDGTVLSVRRGERTVELARFDFAANISAGTRLTLPPIAGPDDLAFIRAELGRLFREPAPTTSR